MTVDTTTGVQEAIKQTAGHESTKTVRLAAIVHHEGRKDTERTKAAGLISIGGIAFEAAIKRSRCADASLADS
jgi:hypothetical protein